VGCWSHARRKVYDVYEETASPLAKEALERIAELFAIEVRIKGRPPPERLAVRQQDAVPLLAELHAFLEKALSQISGKSTLAKAIRYSLSRWNTPTRYTTDGRLEMTNNAVERASSPFTACAASANRSWRRPMPERPIQAGKTSPLLHADCDRSLQSSPAAFTTACRSFFSRRIRHSWTALRGRSFSSL
jgi:Transposase IS66 family